MTFCYCAICGRKTPPVPERYVHLSDIEGEEQCGYICPECKGKAMEEITLTLTLEEAYTLYNVGMHVGGYPEKSPRGFMNRIRNKVEDALRGKRIPTFAHKAASIYFVNDLEHCPLAEDIRQAEREVEEAHTRLVSLREEWARED